MDKEEIRALKTSTCPSLSQSTTLTYDIGCGNDKAIHIRLTGSTGKGIFNKGWVPLAELDPLLTKDKPVTAKTVRTHFQGKSSNTAGFLMAVLVAEGLLNASPDDPHIYLGVDPAEFKKGIEALAADKSKKSPAGKA